jgi:hypothetical protein
MRKRGDNMSSSTQPLRTLPSHDPSTRPTRHLGQKELARRWNLSHRTLERWRSHGDGPRFLKLNGRCLYRLEDVELFEQARLKASTSSATASAAR